MKKHHMPLKRNLTILVALLLCTGIGAGMLRAGESEFRSVTGPCHLTFPADHGPHAEYRTEWWYYTGNVADDKGRRFGFQLTFFRSALQAPDRRRHWPDPASAWRTDQVYLAHAAVADITGGRHLQAEQMARPVLSMAGAYRDDSNVSIHLHSWQAVITAEGHRLQAAADDFAFSLNLRAVKPPIRHGDGGYSVKGQSPERASCYYSFTRMQASGSITVQGRRHVVEGPAWMDHEFSTAPLQPGTTGWDWFSLQLDEQTDVMLYLLRQADGTVNPASSGTVVASTGRSLHLEHSDVRIRPLAYWTSPHTDARYPVKWHLHIPSLQLELTVAANLKDQEMRTLQSTNVVYWEGSVQAVGTRGGHPVEGVGYVELTGYARPFDAPM